MFLELYVIYCNVAVKTFSSTSFNDQLRLRKRNSNFSQKYHPCLLFLLPPVSRFCFLSLFHPSLSRSLHLSFTSFFPLFTFSPRNSSLQTATPAPVATCYPAHQLYSTVYVAHPLSFENRHSIHRSTNPAYDTKTIDNAQMLAGKSCSWSWPCIQTERDWKTQYTSNGL